MVQQLGNAEYQVEWAYPQRVRLREGVFWQRLTPRSPVELRVAMVAQAPGDLDGDDAFDAAVLLAAQAEGSYPYYYLAAVVNDHGRPRHVATAGLGQDLEIRDLVVCDRRILLDVVDHDPATPVLPPQPVETWAFGLEGDQLLRQ
jgi:hypothetical protein